MRVTKETFIEESKFFAGVLISKKGLYRYYTAYAGGAFGICSSILKEILNALGSNNFLPLVHKDLFDQLKLVNYNVAPHELMQYIPNNSTLSFPDGILGTRVNGNYSLSNLISYNETNGFVINRKEIIFRDLLEAVITSSYGHELKNKLFYSLIGKMHDNIKYCNLTQNLQAAYEAIVLREFFLLSKISNLAISTFLVNPIVWEPIESIIKGNLLIHKLVVEDEVIVCNHLLDRSRDKFRYNRALDILGTGYGESGVISIFPYLINTLRL